MESAGQPGLSPSEHQSPPLTTQELSWRNSSLSHQPYAIIAPKLLKSFKTPLSPQSAHLCSSSWQTLLSSSALEPPVPWRPCSPPRALIPTDQSSFESQSQQGQGDWSQAPLQRPLHKSPRPTHTPSDPPPGPSCSLKTPDSGARGLCTCCFCASVLIPQVAHSSRFLQGSASGPPSSPYPYDTRFHVYYHFPPTRQDRGFKSDC